MALPTTRIQLDSPYMVGLTRANLGYIVIELYIYTGTLTTDKPSTYTIKLTKTAHPDENASRSAFVDIAGFARDYVSVSYDFDNDTPTNAVWVEWDLYYVDIDTDVANVTLTLDSSTVAVGLGGFGYFHEEENPTVSPTILQSNDTMYLPDSYDGEIPVLQDFLTSFTLADTSNGQQTILSTTSGLSTTENTANVIYYVSTATTSGQPTAVYINYTGGRPQETVNIVYVDHCRYDPVEVAFVNKHGAVQKLYFFGKTTKSINTTETTYKQNILTYTGTYDSKDHQVALLKKNGTANFTLNSGWYPENMNGVFQELMLSPKVWAKVPQDWLDYDTFTTATKTSPVLIKNSSLQFKTRIDDNLINYTINVDVAADAKNSVK